jgi:hypothetical protein
MFLSSVDNGKWIHNEYSCPTADLYNVVVISLALLNYLKLLIFCCGDVELNPGPVGNNNVCGCCKSKGRRSQVFIACSFCETYYHRACSRISPDCFRRLITGCKWTCWSCSMPNPSDSSYSNINDSICSQSSSNCTNDSAGTEQANSLTVLSFNARSSKSKYSDVLALVDQRKPDIICVCETWLSSSIPDGCVLPVGYTLCRKDRVGVSVVSWLSFNSRQT